jgi:hypothetical protein
LAAIEAVFFISYGTAGFAFRRCWRQQIRRIQIILPGNADQREQGITAGIGQRRMR